MARKDFWISKRKNFDHDENTIRKLVLIKGQFQDVPINKIIQKLKLKGNWEYASYDNNPNGHLIMEKIERKLRKKAGIKK